MLIPALLVLGTLGQTAVPKSAPRAGAEVALEASPILVPALPRSVAEARKGYPRVRKDLEASYREAEKYLQACTAELAAQGQPEATIAIPATFAAEAKVLGQYLFDETFLSLEDPLLDGWNAWQNTLLATGLAQPKEAQRMADNMLLLSSSKAEVAGTAPGPGEAPLEISWEAPSGPGSLVLPRRRAKFIEVLAVDRMNYGANTEFGKRASLFADTQAAQLAQRWEPLTAHLNQSAASLLDLDRTCPPTTDPGMRALRLLARINFMERFRSTLWFCQVVWAHLASERILPMRMM